MGKKRNKIVTTLILGAISFGCREDGDEWSQTQVRTAQSNAMSGQKTWAVQVSPTGLSLAAGSLAIEHFVVGFEGCSDPDFTVLGESGTVYSSAACTGVTYKSIQFTPVAGHEPLFVEANVGSAKDDSGNAWQFVALPEINKAILIANFSSATETASVQIFRDYNPWQNPVDRFDVNNDGRVSSLDALKIINRLSGGPELPPENNTGLFYDVNGDGRVTSLDALQVNNEIARRQNN